MKQLPMDNFTQTLQNRHQTYLRYIGIVIITMPLLTLPLNILTNNYIPGIYNFSAGVVFALIFLYGLKGGKWVDIISGIAFQIYISGHALFLLPGKYIEARLGLFTVILPTLATGRTFWFFFVTNAILYHLPPILGHYEKYYEFSYLLYVSVCCFIYYYVGERKLFEQELFAKNTKIEEQKQKIAELDKLTKLTAAENLDNQWLANFNQLVQNRLGEFELSIDDLAEALEISRTQLFRKVKEKTGHTPNQYLTEARLQRAKSLLENAEVDSVKSAYLSIGIKNAGYFSKLFKKRFGESPSDFAKKEMGKRANNK